jgi:hypothetical protein
MKMTLLNMVSSMMFFKNIKLMFWDDAVIVQFMSKTCFHLMLLETRLHMKCGMATFLW